MSQPRLPTTPLTLGAIAVIAGLIGFGVSAGMWSGAMAERVDAHESRIERLERLVFDLRNLMARVDRKIDQLGRPGR